LAGNLVISLTDIDRKTGWQQAKKETMLMDTDDIFWGSQPNKEKLNLTCKKILGNIEKVKSIPIEKRKYDF